jgi:hypothetical protein
MARAAKREIDQTRGKFKKEFKGLFMHVYLELSKIY